MSSNATTPLARQAASGPFVWHGADFADRDWILRLDDADCRALINTVRSLAGRELETITRVDFPLPGLAQKLAAIAQALAHGPGFVLLRGLPLADLNQDEIERIYWGIGCHLGVIVSQSTAGDRLGHVFDRGDSTQERYYTRGGALEFHVDPVDTVGLLCLRPAREGGASRIVSAAALHNILLDERPDLLDVLYRGFHNSRRGHGLAVPSQRIPVFAPGHRGLECYLLPVTIRQAVAEGHPLSDAEIEAIAYIDEVANRPGVFLDMDFQVGDIQFLNNRVILHSRTDYVDYAEPELKRHLLRLWLMMPQWPPRPSAMDFHDKVDRAGGGVAVPPGLK